jgi:hypothetical protein
MLHIYKMVIRYWIQLRFRWMLYRLSRARLDDVPLPSVNQLKCRVIEPLAFKLASIGDLQAVVVTSGFDNAWHMLECLTYIHATLTAGIDYIQKKAGIYAPVETEDKWIDLKSPYLPGPYLEIRLGDFMVAYGDRLFDTDQYFNELVRLITAVNDLTIQMVGTDF